MARKQHHRGGVPRRHRVYVRVDGDEMGLFRRVAAARGTSVSLMVVDAVRALAGREDARAEERESPTVEQLRAIRDELHRIGVNVNQIAHNVNRDMRATPADEATAARAVEECRRLLDQTDGIIGRA